MCNFCIFNRHTWNRHGWGRGPVHQYHREAFGIQVNKVLVNKPIRKNQQSIGIMWSNGWRCIFTDICMVSRNNQVVPFLADDPLDASQKWNKKIVMQVADQETNHTCFPACEVPGRRLWNI